MEDWDQLRFTQLLETFRSTQTQVSQIALGMILGLVTVIGFAVGRESWGLFGLGVAFELTLAAYVWWFNRLAAELLAEAGDIESRAAGDNAVSAKLGNFVGAGDTITFARLPAIMGGVIAVHVVVTVLTATWLGWTFAGDSP